MGGRSPLQLVQQSREVVMWALRHRKTRILLKVKKNFLGGSNQITKIADIFGITRSDVGAP